MERKTNTEKTNMEEDDRWLESDGLRLRRRWSKVTLRHPE